MESVYGTTTTLARMTPTDLGVGSVVNGTCNRLACISLRWMIRPCFLLNIGIFFLPRDVQERGGSIPPRSGLLPVSTFGPMPTPAYFVLPSVSTSRTLGEDLDEGELDFVNEEEEDLADALSPIYDQLKLAPYWWILESFPQALRYQNDDDMWSRTF
jgi:hypothetical protein